MFGREKHRSKFGKGNVWFPRMFGSKFGGESRGAKCLARDQMFERAPNFGTLSPSRLWLFMLFECVSWEVPILLGILR